MDALLGKAKKAMNWSGSALDAVFKKVRCPPPPGPAHRTPRRGHLARRGTCAPPGSAGERERAATRPPPPKRPPPPRRPPQVKPVLHVAVLPAIVGAGYMMCDPKPDVVAALMPL